MNKSLASATERSQNVKSRTKLIQGHVSVASLRLVSPGAVTDGVILFFRQGSDDLFSVMMSFFFTYRYHSHPLRLPGDRFSSILYKFSRKKSLHFHQGITPWMVLPEAPPSNATDQGCHIPSCRPWAKISMPPHPPS